MKKPALSNLGKVTEVLFLQKLEKVRPVLEQEAILNRQISRLDEQLAEVRRSGSETSGYHLCGADILWHSWEAGTRRTVNMNLARLRAQKLQQMDELRHAFGQREAVREIVKNLTKHS